MQFQATELGYTRKTAFRVLQSAGELRTPHAVVGVVCKSAFSPLGSLFIRPRGGLGSEAAKYLSWQESPVKERDLDLAVPEQGAQVEQLNLLRLSSHHIPLGLLRADGRASARGGGTPERNEKPVREPRDGCQMHRITKNRK
jgi:hypothetical protein